jgi:HAD domain in Swiss Army Knife RNA repair proteins
MRRRVLFIDFDGVLHPSPEHGSLGPSALYMQVGPLGWLPLLCGALREHGDVEVVVHSSWRDVFSVEELSEMLSDLGERRIAVAPPGARHSAIEAWLRAEGEGIEYLVLDDDASEFPHPAPSWLVICNPKSGISGEGILGRLQFWLKA